LDLSTSKQGGFKTKNPFEVLKRIGLYVYTSTHLTSFERK